jgi:hypothetical protein
MQITLRYFDGCPNWRVAEERLLEALGEPGGPEATISYERVETPEDAGRLGFRGSPTLLVDGDDPFAEDDAPVGLACRIYRTEEGPQGAPSIAQLRATLRRG